MVRWVVVCSIATGFCLAQPLTLGRALELAESRHPQLRAGEAQIDAAQAGIRTAQAYPNPYASAGAGRQLVRVPGNVTGLVTTFGVEQPIELRELRQTRVRYADGFRQSSVFAQALTRLSVLSGVRRAFFQVLRRRGEIGIAQENLKLVEDLRQRIQVRVSVGEAGRLELVRAEAEVATARALLNSAELQQINAVSQLQAAVGDPLNPGVTLEGALDPPVALPALEDVRQEALSRHPLLQFAQSEVRRAESRIPYEQALRKPQPSVRSDYERYPDVPNFRFGV